MKQKKTNIILLMTALLMGSFITTLAETLMNNGLPDIMKETHVTQMMAQWLNTGYMLVAGMFMPMAAFFMHRFPLKKLFLSTMSLFLTGTVIAAIAPNFTFLLIGRLVQASAVGINMPLVTNVLTVVFPAEKRGLALGIAGIIINLGPAIGPTLSGLILEYFHWRMLFILLIPLTILTILLTLIGVTNVLKPQKTSLDLPSCLLSIFSLGLMLYSISRFGVVNSNRLLAGFLLIISVIALIIFIKRQLKLEKPLLEMRVFKYPRYILGLLIALLASAAIMAPELMLPLFNQEVLRVSPIVSGAVMIPSALAMAIFSPIAGNIYDKYGLKKMAIVGVGLALITTIPMAFYNNQTSITILTILYALRSGGLIFGYTPASVYALNSLPKKYVVSGNTIIVTMVQMANSFGTTLAVMAQSMGQNANKNLGTNAAMLKGYQLSFLTTVIVTAIALILIFMVKKKKQTQL